MSQEVKRVENGDITTINVINKSSSELVERKLYEINKVKKEVRVFRKGYGSGNDFYVVFEGFRKIPDIFSETSNSDQGTLDSIQKHIERYHYKKLIISISRKSEVDGENIVINYREYLGLLSEIESIKSRNRLFKQRERSKFLKNIFPDIFSGLKTSFPSLCDNISKEIIDEEVLRRLELERLLDIAKMSSNVVKQKYGKDSIKFHKNITIISNLPILKEASQELEKLIKNKKNKEFEFSEYLKSTFPLLKFDCVHLEKDLNLICAGAKKTDFLMINSEGFADIFEIKTPRLKMLKYDKSHQNYYWSPEASKAIAQIEKYLDQSQQNRLPIKDSLSKRGIHIDLIKPKGILIMGSDEELNTKKKDEFGIKTEDFRILRSSLKNIEILTYSDLLRSLSNLVKSNEEKSVENK